MDEKLKELYALKQEMIDAYHEAEGDLWASGRWDDIHREVLRYIDEDDLAFEHTKIEELLKELKGIKINAVASIYLPLMKHLSDTIDEMDVDLKARMAENMDVEE